MLVFYLLHSGCHNLNFIRNGNVSPVWSKERENPKSALFNSRAASYTENSRVWAHSQCSSKISLSYSFPKLLLAGDASVQRQKGGEKKKRLLKTQSHAKLVPLDQYSSQTIMCSVALTNVTNTSHASFPTLALRGESCAWTFCVNSTFSFNNACMGQHILLEEPGQSQVLCAGRHAFGSVLEKALLQKSPSG